MAYENTDSNLSVLLCYCLFNVILSSEDHGSEELAARARKLDLFWSGLRPVLDSWPPESRLHDVAQLSYTVPDLSPQSHTQDPEAEVSWA